MLKYINESLFNKIKILNFYSKFELVANNIMKFDFEVFFNYKIFLNYKKINKIKIEFMVKFIYNEIEITRINYIFDKFNCKILYFKY